MSDARRYLGELDFDPKISPHTLTALHILDVEAAEFLAADPVVKESREDGAIPDALERIVGRRIEQPAGLGVAGVVPCPEGKLAPLSPRG